MLGTQHRVWELFLMGWSPLLWSVGYQLLGSAGDLFDETRAPLGSC